MAGQPALLLIADISGFTRFSKMHRVSDGHSHLIIARLLNAMVQAAGAPLQVAELEGDAVFFYALTGGEPIKDTVAKVKRQIPALFKAFSRELASTRDMTMCRCDACDQMDQLRLKQVAHVGEVALEKIDRFEKLFGIDVIIVHRLLKNSVPADEYLLLSDATYEVLGDFYGGTPERRVEEMEGVGSIDTVVFYSKDLTPTLESTEPETPALPAPASAVLRWRMQQVGVAVRSLFRPTPRAT